MRRKGAMERKIETLEDAERLLLDLVETLKDDQNIRTSQLINLIRSNASLDEIRLFLERQFSPEERETMPAVGETQNHLAKMPMGESRARPGRGVMAIQRLADIPVHRVPAKPWTNVTDDDDLVSHLVSIWCTWSHPWFHWINRDLFIRDMQAGDLEAEFCSPFLVNTILAETSVCNRDPFYFYFYFFTPPIKQCLIEANEGSFGSWGCSYTPIIPKCSRPPMTCYPEAPIFTRKHGVSLRKRPGCSSVSPPYRVWPPCSPGGSLLLIAGIMHDKWVATNLTDQLNGNGKGPHWMGVFGYGDSRSQGIRCVPSIPAYRRRVGAHGGGRHQRDSLGYIQHLLVSLTVCARTHTRLIPNS